MQVNITETYEELSEAAAELVIAQLRDKPDTVLGLAAGSTPVLLYQKLAEAKRQGLVDFAEVRTFALDEYIGLGPEHPQSFYYFMQKNVYGPWGLREDQIEYPNGMAVDIATECARYGRAIASGGGIDLMILGIGPNAHIGFNEPGESFVSETHVVELSEATRAANARFFEAPDEVPEWAISMGIRDIMLSKSIIMLANGSGKTTALKKAVTGDINPFAPASVLQLHRDAIVLADKAAAARLPQLTGE